MLRTFDQISLSGKRNAVVVRRIGRGYYPAAMVSRVAKANEIDHAILSRISCSDGFLKASESDKQAISCFQRRSVNVALFALTAKFA